MQVAPSENTKHQIDDALYRNYVEDGIDLSGSKSIVPLNGCLVPAYKMVLLRYCYNKNIRGKFKKRKINLDSLRDYKKETYDVYIVIRKEKFGSSGFLTVSMDLNKSNTWSEYVGFGRAVSSPGTRFGYGDESVDLWLYTFSLAASIQMALFENVSNLQSVASYCMVDFLAPYETVSYITNQLIKYGFVSASGLLGDPLGERYTWNNPTTGKNEIAKNIQKVLTRFNLEFEGTQGNIVFKNHFSEVKNV